MLHYPRFLAHLPHSQWPYGVYALINCANGRAYVGSTWSSLYNRLRNHEIAFRSQTQQRAMQADWDKGHDFYSIIMPGQPKHMLGLRILETYWICRMQQSGNQPYNAHAPNMITYMDSYSSKLSETVVASHLRYLNGLKLNDDQFLASIEILNNLLSCHNTRQWGSIMRLYKDY